MRSICSCCGESRGRRGLFRTELMSLFYDGLHGSSLSLALGLSGRRQVDGVTLRPKHTHVVALGAMASAPPETPKDNLLVLANQEAAEFLFDFTPNEIAEAFDLDHLGGEELWNEAADIVEEIIRSRWEIAGPALESLRGLAE